MHISKLSRVIIAACFVTGVASANQPVGVKYTGDVGKHKSCRVVGQRSMIGQKCKARSYIFSNPRVSPNSEGRDYPLRADGASARGFCLLAVGHRGLHGQQEVAAEVTQKKYWDKERMTYFQGGSKPWDSSKFRGTYSAEEIVCSIGERCRDYTIPLATVNRECGPNERNDSFGDDDEDNDNDGHRRDDGRRRRPGRH